MFRLSGKGTWGDTCGVRCGTYGVADGDRVLSENEIYY